MYEMLNPREVGITNGRDAVFPSAVFFQLPTTPVAVIKRRIGEDEICFQIRVFVIQKRSFVL